jgi:hypothetical protein
MLLHHLLFLCIGRKGLKKKKKNFCLLEVILCEQKKKLRAEADISKGGSPS